MREHCALTLEQGTSLGLTPWAWPHMGVFFGRLPVGVALIGRGSSGRGLLWALPCRKPAALLPGHIPGGFLCALAWPARGDRREDGWVKGLGQRESGQPPWAS